MSRRDKNLPPIEVPVPLWLALLFLAISAGLIAEALRTGDDLKQVACMLLLFPCATLAVCISYARRRVEERRHAAAARSLGLHYRPRVRESDITPFLSLSLFALSAPWGRKGNHLMEGVVDGQRVILFQFRCELHYRAANDLRHSWWAEQTLILFPDVGYVLPFLFTPEVAPSRLLLNGRAWSPTIGTTVVEVELEDGTVASVRGNDEGGLKRLFCPERVEAMAPLGTWTVESALGRLMLYQAGYVLEPDELPRYLHQAVRIASALRSAGFDSSLGPPQSGASPHVQPGPEG
jgi:hypothetical protein